MLNAEGGSRVTLQPGADPLHDRFHGNEMNFEDQMAELERGAHEVLIGAELVRKLKRGVPLRVKAGFDPTAPDLHLGHTVLLNKMRQFQQLGHEVTFLIGDFTGLIGDPSGRDVTRPPLTPEEIQANAGSYQAQVFKILDRGRTRIEFNSRWLSALTAADVVKLAAHYTVARMLERDDLDRKSTRLNSSHRCISYAVFCLKKKRNPPFLSTAFTVLTARHDPASATSSPIT